MKRLYLTPLIIVLGLGFGVLSACTSAPHSEPDTVSSETNTQSLSYGAYMIVMGKDYDPVALAKYSRALPPIYEKYDGEYVAIARDFDVAEGVFDYQAVIITGWPSTQAARAFWDSPEYAEARKLREGNGTFDVMILPALPKQAATDRP